MHIPTFLIWLKTIKIETGQRIAKRIEFDACSTFTNLKAEDVASLRQAAKDLNASMKDFTLVITMPNGAKVTHDPWTLRDAEEA